MDVQAAAGRALDSATGRRTGASQPLPAVSRATRHLAFVATLSHDVVVSGTRISIVVDVAPKKGMHVYAPGTGNRPFAITLEPRPWLRVHDAVYPKPTVYLFKPLNEQLLVYAAPFRVVRDVTVGDLDDQRPEPQTFSWLTITGILEYQACDDTVCYLPTSIPLEWRVKFRR